MLFRGLNSWQNFIFSRLSKNNKPDLILVSSMSLWPAIYAVRMRKRYKIPFILEIRDIWPLTPVEVGGFSKRNPFIYIFRKLEKFAYSRADSIISVLSHFNKHLSTVIKEPKQFYWIPNAIENSVISGNDKKF